MLGRHAMGRCRCLDNVFKPGHTHPSVTIRHFGIDQDGFVSAAKQLPIALLVAIKALRRETVEVAHGPTQLTQGEYE